ncbi:MAG: type II toxin-antitoxin system VapC family toxin [Candidatus Micrarchaeota archaeon]|nr:type II toxin-antitoxin system VapC family toxin [Candidatus Micrarchaeota archaeon]MDE1847756.1 type II toxin-antitoxin system VapC family toxin [Candidatus Micrarchaeota archaeon]MDE1863899.1 type II toxin-antitoxin system VapC family toxin [Candidatus Micrarchaeota archaeon]
MACLDTNIIIDYIHGVENARKLIEDYRKSEQITTTTATMYELLSSRDQQERQLATEFLSRIKVYVFDERASEVAANIRRKLELFGKLINDTDIMIAGIAFANDETLVTQDRDFERINSGRIDLVKE